MTSLLCLILRMIISFHVQKSVVVLPPDLIAFHRSSRCLYIVVATYSQALHYASQAFKTSSRADMNLAVTSNNKINNITNFYLTSQYWLSIINQQWLNYVKSCLSLDSNVWRLNVWRFRFECVNFCKQKSATAFHQQISLLVPEVYGKW